MSCQAVKNGEVIRMGKSSIEYLDDKGNPVYYCYGYIDYATDELIATCSNCKRNAKYAQGNLDLKYKQ